MTDDISGKKIGWLKADDPQLPYQGRDNTRKHDLGAEANGCRAIRQNSRAAARTSVRNSGP